jgi:hypothetical protein
VALCHAKVFDSLIQADVPTVVAEIVNNWYGKLFVNVRWRTASLIISLCFWSSSGSVLSPSLFNVFMHLFIVRLHSTNDGCIVKSKFLGRLLYADDIILRSPPVKGLQQLSNTSVEDGNLLFVKFNASKSFCLFVGKLHVLDLEPMLLSNAKILRYTPSEFIQLVVKTSISIAIL